MKGVQITYGKTAVPLPGLRHAAHGLAPVPESSFTGRENTLMAVEVDVEVFGENFLPAYTEGDNSAVVATDSMKNFILAKGTRVRRRHARGLPRPARAGLPRDLRRHDRARASRGRELRFDLERGVLYSRSHDDHGVAQLHVPRDGDGRPALGDLRSGRVGLELLKVTGSSFTRFVRDEYTTLPERVDRPLYIHLDVHWRYAEIADATGRGHVALRRIRAGARRGRRGVLRARLRVDPAARVGDVRTAARALPTALRGLVHRAEPHARAGGRARGRPAGARVEDPFPAFGTITPDAGERSRL